MVEITRDPDVCGGQACVGGHRIRVLDIALAYEHEGLSPDQIVARYPSLGLPSVHTALAYYYEHSRAMRDEIAAEESAFAAAAAANQSPLLAKLLARRDLAS